MSKHFKVSCALLLIGAVGLWVLYHRIAQKVTTAFPELVKSSTVLPSTDKERVSFNEKTHTLTVQTATKTIQEYAKNPTVEITKSGAVKVTRHLLGLENEPCMGVGMVLSGPRFFLGDNVYHLSRFDVQGSLGLPFNRQVGFIRLYGGLGYNLYSNSSLNLALNPFSLAPGRIPDIAVFVSTRL